MKRKTAVFLAILAGLASVAGSARADVFAYGVDVLDNLNLVDLTTATSSVIGPTNAPLEGLALSPGGALYGSGANGLLYSMDRTTGAATAIGNTGLFDVGGLAFNGSTLLGTNFNVPTSVYTIDPTTAASTLLVTTSPSEGKATAMALLDANTALIASGTTGNNQSLVSINLTTGATLVLGTIQDPNLVAAMAFGPGGILYGLDSKGNEIIISTVDGSTTTVGNTGGQFWLDMTIIPAAVPEPSSLALLGVAGVLGLGARLRRRARG